MPKQEFVLSFLTHPQDYQREVTGVRVPLSFSLLDIAGYVFTYSPVAGFDGYIMDDMLLGETPLIHETLIDRVELLAQIDKAHESFKDSLIEAVKEYKDSAAAHEVYLSERRKNEEAVFIDDMQTGMSTKEHEASISYVELAASERLAHETLLLERIIMSDRPEMKVQAVIDELIQSEHAGKVHDLLDNELILADKNRVLGSISQDQQIMASIEKVHGAVLERIVDGYKSKSHEIVIEKPFIYAIRDSRPGRIIDTVIQSVRDGRAGRKLTEWVGAVRHIWGAKIDRDFKQGVRIPKEASSMARIIYGVLKARDAVIENSVLYGVKSPRLSQIDHPVILGKFHTPESYIMKAISLAEKDGMGADIYQAIVADTKMGKDTTFVDGIIADGKAYVDAYIDMEAGKPASVKRGIDAITDLIVTAFTKQAHDTEWIEQTLFALVSDSHREVFIDKLREFEKVDKDSIAHALEAAEVPDAEAILLEMQDTAWNKDKDNRPAGMLHDAGLGYWDIGFDDLLDTWEPGWDYLAPPNKDYDYEKAAPQVYDANGVPYAPLSPVNLPEVDVDTPVTHPFPDWDTVGETEAWVEIYTYQDVLINIATIFKKETARLAGMTGQQALQYVLRESYAILESQGLLNAQYERTFRFIRWYAEAIANEDSVTVLNRVYDDWSDNIMNNGGVFTYPHTQDQMKATALGTIESTSTTGFIEFDVEGFIDGKLTLSMVISTANPTSTSEIRLYIDGVLTHTHLAADGAKRLSFDVPMGVRNYRIEYDCEMGDIAKLSGIKISGVHFVEAYTTLRDKGTVRGLRAVNSLIQNLLTYYQRHHKGKMKGSMAVKQRKLWLN